METRASHFVVGLVTLVVMVGLTVFVVWLGHAQFTAHGKRYRILFDTSLSGLQIGSPVRISGVSTGSVTSIALDPAIPGQVTVVIDVNPDTPVRMDTVAATQMANVTGTTTIELRGGTVGSPDRKTGDGDDPAQWAVIPADTKSSSNLLVALPHLIDRMDSLIDRLDRVASDDNIALFGSMLVRLNHMSAALDQQTPKIAQTLDNADALLTALRVQVPGLTTQAASTLRDIHGTDRKLDDLIDQNSKPLHDFTTEGLMQVDGLVYDLRTLSQSLNRVSSKVERNPRAVVFGTDGGVPAQ